MFEKSRTVLCTPRQDLLAKYPTRLERTSDQINHPRPIFRITIDCHDVRGDLNTWHNDHVKTGSVHHLRVEHPCLGLRRNYCCRSWAPTAGERGGRRKQPATLGVSAGRNLRWDFWELFSLALFDKILFKVIRQAALRKFTSRNGVRKKWWVCHTWKPAHTLSWKTCRFVLFGPTTTEPARLEYWDNERKWRAKTPPKRSIVLQKCFNINRKLDTRSGWRSKEIALVWHQLFLMLFLSGILEARLSLLSTPWMTACQLSSRRRTSSATGSTSCSLCSKARAATWTGSDRCRTTSTCGTSRSRRSLLKRTTSPRWTTWKARNVSAWPQTLWSSSRSAPTTVSSSPTRVCAAVPTTTGTSNSRPVAILPLALERSSSTVTILRCLSTSTRRWSRRWRTRRARSTTWNPLVPEIAPYRWARRSEPEEVKCRPRRAFLETWNATGRSRNLRGREEASLVRWLLSQGWSHQDRTPWGN